MNIQERGAKIRTQFQTLHAQFPSGDCVMVTLENSHCNTKGGSIIEVPLDLAARGLVDGTHKLASKEEEQKFRDAQRAAAQDIQKREIERRASHVFTHPLPAAPDKK